MLQEQYARPSLVDGKLPLCIYTGLVKYGRCPIPIFQEVLPIRKQHNLRILDSDFDVIKAKAEKANMSITDYIIVSAKQQQIIILDDLRPLCHELRKIGTNLNQLTMLAHQGKITCVNLLSLDEAVKSLWQPLNLLTEKIRRIKR